MQRPISEIKIGTRHRKDLGDIDALARAINDVGLLHPIVITPDGKLIAGERRIEAYKRLGRMKIPVTVIDLEQIARGELAENVERKDFTPTEIDAIRRALLPLEKAAAKQRQGTRVDKHPGNFPGCSKGQARDKIGAFGGISGRTVEKIAAVCEAAEAEPEKLAADMDRTRRVNGPYKRLKVIKQAAAIRAEPPPYPNRGPYRVISCDLPWPYEIRQEDPSHRATHPYPTMSIAQMCAERDKVNAIAHEDCILWMWTTNYHMRFAYTVLDVWGFEPKTILTWVKNRAGTGDWLRGQTEHCLMATRGRPIVELTNQTTVLYGPLRANSQKPDEFYAFVEKLCPAPRYAELFARSTRPNWDGHGDEVPKEKACA